MSGSAKLPPHAYVPGKTKRHPDGWFDAIRDTARAGMSSSELAESAAFRTGLVYLDAGYFWEAHEVLEPVWMVLPEGCEERRLLQALIQFSNANLKLEMGRPKAALRLCGIVKDLLSTTSFDAIMSIEIAGLVQRVDSLEQGIST